MVSVIIIIIGISALILVHELGHFLAAKYFGVPVEEFGFGFPPRIVSKKMGETRYSLNWLPFGGFVKLHGEFAGDDPKSFVSQKAWRRAVILVAGVTMNFIFGWLLLSIVFFIGAPSYVLVNKVLPESPAIIAGILEGDRLAGFSTAKEFTDFIKENQNKEISLKIFRQEENNLKEIEIKAIPNETLGVMITDIGLPRQSFFKSIGSGFVASISIIWAILIALGSVFSSAQNFVGPIGIFDVAIQTGKLGAIYVFQLLALISLNLTVLNLLPVPALDGGRLLFVIIEKLRRKPFSPLTEIRANTVGFVILIALIVFVTFNDILRMI